LKGTFVIDQTFHAVKRARSRVPWKLVDTPWGGQLPG